ncbi:MAG: methionine gamma-lyase family protein, partial [Desulfotomaculales bacterium]
MPGHRFGLLLAEVEKEIQPVYEKIDRVAFFNQQRVLNAFREFRVSYFHLQGTTGYGYGDRGRETLEKVYAAVFETESALVRGQIVSGTHALALCLFGVLRPGDELLTVQGEPYETLQTVIGIGSAASGCLRELGVNYRQVDLLPDGSLDWQGIAGALSSRTKMVLLQRSRGYARRP